MNIYVGERNALRAEVERLRSELELEDRAVAVLIEQRDALRAEVERLRAALEMVRDADDDCRKDGLRTIPEPARRRIEVALDAAREAGA